MMLLLSSVEGVEGVEGVELTYDVVVQVDGLHVR